MTDNINQVKITRNKHGEGFLRINGETRRVAWWKIKLVERVFHRDKVIEQKSFQDFYFILFLTLLIFPIHFIYFTVIKGETRKQRIQRTIKEYKDISYRAFFQI